jgi:hypothetical protein
MNAMSRVSFGLMLMQPLNRERGERHRLKPIVDRSTGWLVAGGICHRV